MTPSCTCWKPSNVHAEVFDASSAGSPPSEMESTAKPGRANAPSVQ
jgi:hypothetical protein